LLSLQTDYDRLLSLKEKAKTSDFWNNPEKAQEDTKLQNSIEKKLSPWLEIRQEIIDFPDLIEMTIEEKGDNALEELNQEFSFLSSFYLFLFSEARAFCTTLMSARLTRQK
jgi:peptide chain release factor 2